MNTPVSFELAKLLFDAEYDGFYNNFYAKPRSKMFSIDEHKRYYPIKNISKKLYTIGKHFVANSDNCYLAPTIAEVVMWLYEKHGIWISVLQMLNHNKVIIWYASYYEQGVGEDIEIYYESSTEAYEKAIEYTLKNLI